MCQEGRMAGIQWIAVDAINPNACNARAHAMQQKREMADRIAAFGCVRALLRGGAST